MPRSPVYTDAMDTLERKIVSGEYMLKDLPGERKLAEELGVSYMTARKAVLGLIDKQVLTRRPNGSLIIHPGQEGKAGLCQVALLTPAYPSTHFVHCRLALSRATAKRDIQFRPVEYVNWDESIVLDAVEGSDGVIIIPSTDPIPGRVMRALKQPAAKVVFFDDDQTEQGIPSIRLYAREHITQLFEHLRSLGHDRIDCLNTQGRNDEILRRVRHWTNWLKESGCDGVLWDNPTPPFEDPTARAHTTMLRALRNDDPPAKTLVCTTQPAAIGAIRACADMGLRVGKDICIATINNEPTGQYLYPSLTGLEMPDIEPLLDRCLEWFASEERDWVGPMRIVHDAPQLFLGESTGSQL